MRMMFFDDSGNTKTKLLQTRYDVVVRQTPLPPPSLMPHNHIKHTQASPISYLTNNNNHFFLANKRCSPQRVLFCAMMGH